MLMYRIHILGLEEVDDTKIAKEVSYDTFEVSHTLSRPPGADTAQIKSEAVAAAEFRAIMIHKHFRTHIDDVYISRHDLHSLLDAFQNRRKIVMTIELRRSNEQDDERWSNLWPPPEGDLPMVTVATLQFAARITHVFAGVGDSYEVTYQILGGTTQQVTDDAENFEVPKPRPAVPPKRGPKRRVHAR